VLKENELKILTDNIAKLKIKLSEEKIPSMMDVYNTIFGNGDSYFLDDDSKINAIYKGECVAYKDDWNLQISKQRAESTLLNIQWQNISNYLHIGKYVGHELWEVKINFNTNIVDYFKLKDYFITMNGVYFFTKELAKKAVDTMIKEYGKDVFSKM
jgi:hypothetical protein